MDLRALFRFGSGVGIEIREDRLEVAVARVRPAGIQVLGRTSIADFRERPAAEWGAEYAAFLKKCGVAYLSATVLLPRTEVIVRHLAMPGVAAADLEAAIGYQIDSLHPYGEEEVAWGWSRTAEKGILAGLTRRATLNRYIELFSEAGIAVAAFTFTAAAMHAAVRLQAGGPPAEFVAFAPTPSGGVEVYGESRARPAFSAEFELPPERALALAAAELRLPSAEPKPLADVLPAPEINPVENDLTRNALPYATALAGACPRLTPAANLLPPQARASNSRAMYVPTIVLGVLFLAAAGALAAHSSIQDRRYLRKVEAEIARLEPAAKRWSSLDGEIEKAKQRAALLESFRERSRTDLDALNEITRLLPPPVWTSAVDLTRDVVMIAGEADQSATLLETLDASPLFQNSEFTGGLVRTGANEIFRINTRREVKR
jgi:Tfp pilus assembly protein PilN